VQLGRPLRVAGCGPDLLVCDIGPHHCVIDAAVARADGDADAAHPGQYTAETGAVPGQCVCVCVYVCMYVWEGGRGRIVWFRA
jgi:hypothetical protein